MNQELPEAKKRPKIVRIIGRLVSGPARNACLLHEELRRDFETRLICGSPCPGEHDMAYLLSSEQDVYRLPEMSREIALSDLKALFQLWRILRRERPQILHTHTAKAGALGRAAGWLAGVPVTVHTYHGHVFHGYFSERKTRLFLRIERLLAKVTSRIVAISESQRSELSRKYGVAPAGKITVVQNGFHFPEFSPEQRNAARRHFGFQPHEFVLVWAGRMAPVKDVRLLAETVRAAYKFSSPARFLVVGDGEERPVLEGLTKGCDNVRLLGWQKDMDLIWQAADAAILTSRNEGTPTALIEAMAAGLPFVSTDVGGVRDLAAGECLPLPGEFGLKAGNGYLTPRHADALLYAIREMAAHRAQSNAMGARGRQFVRERFAASRLVDEMRDLYLELLGRRVDSATTPDIAHFAHVPSANRTID
ncbi:MAG TPA: glycosyltransferase [Terriglobales bacterium]|nr:glycosyltransferase [Terriglobales bacterium]